MVEEGSRETGQTPQVPARPKRQMIGIEQVADVKRDAETSNVLRDWGQADRDKAAEIEAKRVDDLVNPPRPLLRRLWERIRK
jgi:hypothetical protein